MKTFLDCIPCFLNQALRAGRAVTEDPEILKAILDRAASRIKDMRLDQTPPEMALAVYSDVREVTGTEDPFSQLKTEHITEALSLYPGLRQKVHGSDDPLLTAVRAAIAGNVIDLGASREFRIKEDIDTVLGQEFAVFHMAAFRRAVETAKKILYLGDNAGESVFDRLLIETMGKPVTYAVRGRPVINDVTLDDAMASGLCEAAEVVSSGSPAPGIIPDLCSPEFLRLFHEADMIVSKGQGNYEGLSGTARPVFFLLMAKCPVIAEDIGVEVNDIVLKYSLNQ